ncbi:intraflagellar transport complex B protein 46 C terminal-domain-containing protein [Polychytrium aggregatum]|uniref:intraflagellar transport complex B protein 46 C terminal-domain-containing protein n=1 Tax=Polychytrium aggregatum TaxID=110093 RepID=UPI0022FF11F5|nr:intraflagellar transport complex B protein 46 C terminal-domain-containing protein [Polychytrium aggregatum]KAI9204180.1 intraflagellar transport complex B protein 46 C terminal-domain-containing protein [Polychytrium aggregatum]
MRMVSLKGSISGNSHNLSGSRFDEVDRGKEVTRPSQARSPSYSNASDIKEPMPERHNSGGRSDSEIEDDEALSLDGTDESHSQTHSTSPSDDPTAKFANESERPTAPQKSGATAGAVSRPQQQSAGTDSERASKTNGKGNPAVSKSQNPQSTMQSNRQGDLPPEDVPRDVQELFAYIEGYQPEVVDLVTELKCFLPDYIPSIGDIDPMIKIPPPRPIDTSKSKDSFSELSLLGITVIDEPAANQTDSAILDLQLRSAHKSAASAAPQHVRSIQFTSTAESKGYKSLSQWIQNIYNLHLQKPPDTVTYSKRMPEIETLMAEWPAEIESLLSSGEMQVPPPEINLPLGEYATLLCELLDVPVHRSAKSEASSGKKPAGGAKNSKTAYIESLHLLFTLYCEFKASQHFGRTIHGGAERSV